METPKLLIIEEDKIMANFLARRFSETPDMHFDVGITFSGEDALNMISSNPFDVVLLENELPGIDGLETLQRIRSNDNDIQAVLLAEDPPMELLMSALREGVYDVVLKPFEFEHLLGTVKNAVAKRELLVSRSRLIKSLSQTNERLAKDNQSLMVSKTSADEELRKARERRKGLTAYLSASNTGAGVPESAELVIKSAVDMLNRKQVIILFLEEDNLVVKEVTVFEHQFLMGQQVGIEPFREVLYGADEAVLLDYTAEGSTRSLACVRLVNAGEPVGLLCVGNSDDGRPFENAELSILKEFGSCVSISLRSAFLLDQIHKTYLQAILSLLLVSETKDPDIRVHSQRVADYSVKIAREMGFSEADALMVKYAALLHDLGKIGLSQDLLDKEEKLTPDELGEIRQHEIMSDRIVAPMKFLEKTRPMIRHHHERFDGKGYPDGLSGEDIPLGARIVSIADAFDALTSSRSYHERLTRDEAVLKMEADSGWFDPGVLEAFKRVLEKEGGPGWEEEK
jgi:putative nucleotidyltransferase with HDIG domain